MSAGDQDLFGTMIKVENKDIFVDLKKNGSGVYLKLSERNGKVRNTVLIPAAGIGRLKAVLEEIMVISASHAKISPERKQRFAEDPSLLTRSVYVSGLAWTTTAAALTAHFDSVGGIEKAVILSKVRNGKTMSLGCGVVEFHTPEQAAHAVNTMNGSELDGRLIRCREDRSLDNSLGDASSHGDLTRSPQVSGKKEVAPGERSLDPKRLFVTSLPWDVTSASLLAILSIAGTVVSCDVLFTKKGRSLGHAVVELADAATAARVAEQFNGYVLDGRPMVVRAYYMD